MGEDGKNQVVFLFLQNFLNLKLPGFAEAICFGNAVLFQRVGKIDTHEIPESLFDPDRREQGYSLFTSAKHLFESCKKG